jgi:hypothetical protein
MFCLTDAELATLYESLPLLQAIQASGTSSPAVLSPFQAASHQSHISGAAPGLDEALVAINSLRIENKVSRQLADESRHMHGQLQLADVFSTSIHPACLQKQYPCCKGTAAAWMLCSSTRSLLQGYCCSKDTVI